MAKNNLIFKNAEAAKDAIMVSQKKEIAALYESWADEVGERAKFYSRKSTASSVVSERQMKELKKMLRTTSQNVSNEIYGKIKNNMYTISDAVVADNVKWLESFGFNADGLNAAFNYVPDSVVRNIITGQIYDTGWSLSKAIWSDNEKALKDVYQIVAKGVAQNMPIYDIAKNLEAYVSPSKRKSWNITAPDGVKIFKKTVDYNAQRLARTLVQHSYQQSFIATTQKNPFITEYEWNSNGSRVCPLCLARHGERFKKDELPMDHPNGMCVMIPVVADNMVDQLVNWFNSPDGTYPEIDAFASNFGYEAKTSQPIVSVNEAKKLVDNLPSVKWNNGFPSKGGISDSNNAFTPLNYDEDMLTYLKRKSPEFDRDNPEVITISLSDVKTPQGFVHKDAVKSYMDKIVSGEDIKSTDKGGVVSGIQVFEYNGQYYLYEGNHRASAHKLLGIDKIKVEKIKIKR